MKKVHWFWMLLVTAAGAASGTALLQGIGESAAESQPAGWQRVAERVPFRRSDLLGELPNNAKAYHLDHFQGLVAEAPSSTWTIEFELGNSGALRLALSGQPVRQLPGQAPSTAGNSFRGDGLYFQTGKNANTEALSFGSGSKSPLRCSGSIPTPQPGPYRLTLTKTSDGFEAHSAGSTMSCQSPPFPGTPVLLAGLERIRILESQTDQSHFSKPSWASPTWLGWLLGIFLSWTLWWLEGLRGADRRVAALTSFPLLFSWPLISADRLAIVESMRMPSLSETSMAFWIPLGLAAALKCTHHAARLARRAQHARNGLLKSALTGALFPLCVALLSPPHWMTGLLYFTLAGACFGILVGLNARASEWRFVNLLSLGVLLTGCCAAEWGLRWTRTGQSWTPTGQMNFDEQLGWTKSTLSDFEALERAEPTEYPSEGYPVAIEAEQDRTRWVCLGSSATGGAFQNDNLSEFYPSKLQEALEGEVQVLNQGVGGWTSFHMARYALQESSKLRPDILSVYVGHNDILTRSKKPYKDLFAQWKNTGIPDPLLGNVRLFQGLRFLLGSFVDGKGHVAVPVEDARENMLDLHRFAQKHDAKLMLIPEAITPDSSVLKEYSQMLRELADTNNDIVYLDAPSLLLDSGEDLFLDDVHLTDAGHRRLAQAMKQKALDEGWFATSQGLNETRD